MKTLLLIPVIVLLALHSTRAQTDSLKVGKMYHAWVIPAGKGRVTQGVLFEVKDSSIGISNVRNNEDYLAGHYKISELDASNIKRIKLRRIGAQGTGVLIGALSGALVGIIAILGQNTNKGNRLEQDRQQGLSVFIPLLLIGIGTSIGGTIGGAKLNIPIKGSQSQFDQNRSLLTKYSIKNNFVNNTSFSYYFKKLLDTVADVDGNIYHTMALGGQVWMVEDLKTKHFREGSEIPDVNNNNQGQGQQYNWLAVKDIRNLCPGGWHVPSMAAWTSLVNSLGIESDAGSKMEGSFFVSGQVGNWWSSTEADSTHAQSLYVNNKTEGVKAIRTTKNSGLSVRCIRD